MQNKKNEIEDIFYRMWNKNLHRTYIDKYNISQKDYLEAVNIEANNKMFLSELDKMIIKGYNEIDYFLRGLLSSYAKWLSAKFDSGNDCKYYIDWLNNTRMIIGDKFPAIYKWCDDYEKEYFS